MPLLQMRNLVKTFPAGQRMFAAAQAETIAVKGVSFDIHAGEVLGLVGESGCGKTTLGRMLLRLIEPTSGSIHFNGQDVLAASPAQLRRLRRDMQIVFQDPFASLNPRMRIAEIITEPLTVHSSRSRDNDRRRSRSQLHEAATEILRAVGLDESALRRYPHEFSGGQRQRIGIARSLILRPSFLVCDEPVSALDVSVGAQIVNLLKDLQREFGLTMLFISHSMPVVRYLCDRIAVMRRGEIVEIGACEQITAHPAHEYTRSLLAATPEPAFGILSH